MMMSSTETPSSTGSRRPTSTALSRGNGPGARRALESHRRRTERQETIDNELQIKDASVAAAELSDLLNQFTSTKVGAGSSSAINSSILFSNQFMDEFYDDDVMDDDGNENQQVDLSPDPVQQLRREIKMKDRKRINRTLEDRLSAVHPRSSYAGASATPQRNGRPPSAVPATAGSSKGTLQRASTPVMSNASARKLKQQESTAKSATPGSRSLVVGVGVEEDEAYDEEMPVNVQSPWTTTPMTASSVSSKMPSRIVQSTPSTSSKTPYLLLQAHEQQQYRTLDFHRYYDTVCSFVHSKRDSAMDRITNEGQQQHPSLVQIITTSTTADREYRIDLTFLHELSTIAHSRYTDDDHNSHSKDDILSDSNKAAKQESSFWYLLMSLRSLGLAAVLWDDDQASMIQHQQSVQGYIQNVALTYVDYTPKALLGQFYSTVSTSGSTNDSNNTALPFILQRRLSILKWLEYFFNKSLPPNIMTTFTSNNMGLIQSSQNDQRYCNHLAEQGFHIDAVDDTKLLQRCLSLILAGRLSDAQKLSCNNHASWRAALWDGGRPHGYEVVDGTDDNPHNNNEHEQKRFVPTGNPKRSLWRRMTWKLAESMQSRMTSSSSTQSRCSNDYEAAIAAILSSNLRSALDNPCLNKSWEQGLYVIYRAMIDRTEDELLYCHSNHHRRQFIKMKNNDSANRHRGCHGLVYDYEQQELEHLRETSDIASFDESNAMELLKSRPMQQQQQQQQLMKKNATLVIEATSSVLIGRSAIASFMERALLETCQSPSLDITYLRFITHFALYLDSLSSSTSVTHFTLMDGISGWKNELLIRYIHYLASQDDLWYMMIVYASLLPESIIMDILPNLLVSIESEKERKVIVQKLHEFLSIRKDGFDLEVIRKVVRLILLKEDEGNTASHVNELDYYDGATNVGITRSDMKKMKSVLWLTFEDEHLGDAIIAVNILLRQLLLEEDENKRAGEKKIDAVREFINNILPSDLFERAVSVHQKKKDDITEAVDEEIKASSNIAHMIQVEQAKSDFIAFKSYILAIDAVDRWLDIMSSTSPITTTSSASGSGRSEDLIDSTGDLDKTKLNAYELGVAEIMERRNFFDEKRNATASVVSAASTAESLLVDVLEYDGGWLLTDDELMVSAADQTDGVSGEILLRRDELHKLRSKILPRVAAVYEKVCTTTARWMFTSINDALEEQNLSMDETICLLDEKTSNTSSDNNNDDTGKAAPNYSPVTPRYWSQKVFKLASLCASETYGIKSAFALEEDYSNLVQLLAEAAVDDLLYA